MTIKLTIHDDFISLFFSNTLTTASAILPNAKLLMVTLSVIPTT